MNFRRSLVFRYTAIRHERTKARADNALSQVSTTSATEAVKRREAKRQEELRKKQEAEAAQAELDDGFQEIGKAGKMKKDRTKIQFRQDEQITTALVMSTLLQIVSQRGKKGTKIADQQKMLRQLRLIALNNSLGEGVDAVILLQVCFSFLGIDDTSSNNRTLPFRSSIRTSTTLRLFPRTWKMRLGALRTMTWSSLCRFLIALRIFGLVGKLAKKKRSSIVTTFLRRSTLCE